MSADDTELMARRGRYLTDFALRIGWDKDGPEGAFEYVQRTSYAQGLEDASKAGWREAAIAWRVCGSIHLQYARGKDALFTTRQADYQRHYDTALGKLGDE